METVTHPFRGRLGLMRQRRVLLVGVRFSFGHALYPRLHNPFHRLAEGSIDSYVLRKEMKRQNNLLRCSRLLESSKLLQTLYATLMERT